MRFSLTGRQRLAVLSLIAVTTASTGCKTGFQMPGKDLFSWSKKPSESTLAGKGPTATYPTSPANNHTPSQIATATPTAKPTVPTYGSNSYPGVGGMAANNSIPLNQPTTAAGANGYNVGPYAMAGRSSATPPQGSSAAGLSSPTGVPGGSYAPATNLASTPPSNIYGGASTYNGPSSTTSPYGYRATTPAPAPGAPAGYAAVAGAGAGAGQMTPPAYGPSSVNGGYTPSTVAQVPAFATPNLGSMPNAIPGATPTPNYAPTSSFASGAPATSAVAPAGAYRPGSTGRSTGYDFSNQNSYAGNGTPGGMQPPAPSTMMATPPGTTYPNAPIIR